MSRFEKLHYFFKIFGKNIFTLHRFVLLVETNLLTPILPYYMANTVVPNMPQNGQKGLFGEFLAI